MRTGGKKSGRHPPSSPAAIQSGPETGFVSSRLVVARVWKNVKSATSFPPIWTFIDCGRDREGGEGGDGRTGGERRAVPGQRYHPFQK